LVAALSAELRARLGNEPFEALESLGYHVVQRPERDIRGRCNVAGSFDAGPPPTINVVASASHGRRLFTALHEFGHRLVADDAPLQDAFDDENDQGVQLEEDVCDAVAAELLIPDEVVDRHIEQRGPTAHSVLALFGETLASREACCVRASQRIVGSGYVMLAVDGVAQFTAAHNTVYRIRRGTEQPEGQLVRQAAERGSAQGRAQLRFASGKLSPLHWGQAVRDDDYVFAVFVDASPAWIRGPAIAAPDDIFVGADAYCPHCEVDFEAYGPPCPHCGGYQHRRCGRCACGAVTGGPCDQQVCDRCFLRRPPSDFKSGGATCDVCLGV